MQHNATQTAKKRVACCITARRKSVCTNLPNPPRESRPCNIMQHKQPKNALHVASRSAESWLAQTCPTSSRPHPCNIMQHKQPKNALHVALRPAENRWHGFAAPNAFSHRRESKFIGDPLGLLFRRPGRQHRVPPQAGVNPHTSAPPKPPAPFWHNSASNQFVISSTGKHPLAPDGSCYN